MALGIDAVVLTLLGRSTQSLGWILNAGVVRLGAYVLQLGVAGLGFSIRAKEVLVAQLGEEVIR